MENKAAELSPDDETGAYKIPALRALSEITTSLANENDLEELLGRFLGTIVRLADADAGAVRVLTADGSQLRLVNAVGLPAEYLKDSCYIDVECGTCAEAMRRHSMHCSADMKICLEHSAIRSLGDNRRKVVPIPLRYRGKTLGVYNLFLAAQKNIPADIAMLFQSIGEHLGMALENARLTRENMRITLMNERQMLANEVHDSLAQTMAYMKMRLSLLREAMYGGDENNSTRYLNDVSDALDSAYSSLRELLGHFRNRMDPRGLLPALEDAARKFLERSGVEIEFLNNVPDLNLSPDQEVQVFHIVQEALANIHKHARAQRVVVILDIRNEKYYVSVADNGAGMAAQPASGSHFGLAIMRERAQRLNGDIAIESRPGAGTSVTLTFPPAFGCRELSA